MSRPGTRAYGVWTTGAQAASQVARMTRWVGTLLAAQAPEVAARIMASGVVLEGAEKPMRKWAADPARPDYRVATHVRRVRFGEHLPQTDDPLGMAATAFGVAVEHVDAELTAALRAYERYLGAEEADKPAFASERRTEATAYTREAASALQTAAQQLALVDENTAERLDALTTGDVAIIHVPRQLPPNVLATLFLAGISIDRLARYLGRPGVLPWSSGRAKSAAATFTAMSEFTREWEPS